MNENKNGMLELSDENLDQVSGGGDNGLDIDEKTPRCVNCGGKLKKNQDFWDGEGYICEGIDGKKCFATYRRFRAGNRWEFYKENGFI